MEIYININKCWFGPFFLTLPFNVIDISKVLLDYYILQVLQ